MSPEAKQKIQLALLAALVIATIRAGVIFYQRHEDRIEAQKAQRARDLGYSNPDYYVSPKKLYPYDIKSAKQLTQQPVWVKEGYHYTYYRYDPATKHVDFTHEAGLLGPIEKLNITDVIVAKHPDSREQKQVMAVFSKEGKSYAVPIGYEADGEYKIYSDDMFFIEDPHALYKHWPADVWQAVEQHQVKPGMNELQADFAVGMGIPDSGASTLEKTVHYANGGKPLVIVFHDGKAVEVTQAPQGS
jgi:hypothetical protein